MQSSYWTAIGVAPQFKEIILNFLVVQNLIKNSQHSKYRESIQNRRERYWVLLMQHYHKSHTGNFGIISRDFRLSGLCRDLKKVCLMAQSDRHQKQFMIIQDQNSIPIYSVRGLVPALCGISNGWGEYHWRCAMLRKIYYKLW